MTKALPYTQSAIRRAILGAQNAGLRVTGVEVHPDGTIVVRSGEYDTHALLADTSPSWSKWTDEQP